MATLAEIRTKIQKLFGDEDEAVIVAATLNDYINEGIRDIARECELYVPGQATLTTTDANGYISLPSDFLRIRELRYNGRLLPQLSPNIVRSEYGIIEDGEPQGWVPVDYDTLQLWPRKVSGTGLSITISYIGYPADLTVDGNAPSLPLILHNAVVQFALMRCYEQVQDIQMAEYARGDYNRQVMNWNYLRNNPQIDRFASIVDPEIEILVWR